MNEHTAENGARCQSDGGYGAPRSHRCECMMLPGHEGRHGCPCGAMWTCWDCPEADPGEGCAACGALPEGSVFPPACSWCPPGCKSCTEDRDCECYTHQDEPDRHVLPPEVDQP